MSDALQVVLAADQLPEDIGKAGPLGLLLIVLLLIAVALLGRSMGRHLKKLPPSFDPADPADQAPDTPAELFEQQHGGEQVLDSLRKQPRALEAPRRDDDERPAAAD